MNRLHLGAAVVLVTAALGPACWAQPAGPPNVNATQPAELEGVTLNREAGYVDVASVLIRRQADWLELLATTPGSREHETLLTVKAKPSHIHLALLLLGLEPGEPQRVERRGETYITHPPKGPSVALSLIWEEDGQRRQAPANQWILNREADRPLKNNRWLFTGSHVVETDADGRFYMADRAGTVISLVNFGDDVLSRATTASNRSDQERWGANTEVLPPKGTAVTIRITPAKKQEPANAPAATQPTRP
jgi:hypothetical protein